MKHYILLVLQGICVAWLKRSYTPSESELCIEAFLAYRREHGLCDFRILGGCPPPEIDFQDFKAAAVRRHARQVIEAVLA